MVIDSEGSSLLYHYILFNTYCNFIFLSSFVVIGCPAIVKLKEKKSVISHLSHDYSKVDVTIIVSYVCRSHENNCRYAPVQCPNSKICPKLLRMVKSLHLINIPDPKYPYDIILIYLGTRRSFIYLSVLFLPQQEIWVHFQFLICQKS